MDLGLADKSVLVTGSTSGIGKAIARGFLQEAARIFVKSLFPKKVEQTVKEPRD